MGGSFRSHRTNSPEHLHSELRCDRQFWPFRPVKNQRVLHHSKASVHPHFKLVRSARVELACLKAAASETAVSTHSTSYAKKNYTQRDVVPGAGLEPACHFWREILSLLRLPFHHPGGVDRGSGRGIRTLGPAEQAFCFRDRRNRPLCHPAKTHSYFRWWARGDSNPYALRHWNLNPARLPISPLARSETQFGGG